jgi:ComF family protein
MRANPPRAPRKTRRPNKAAARIGRARTARDHEAAKTAHTAKTVKTVCSPNGATDKVAPFFICFWDFGAPLTRICIMLTTTLVSFLDTLLSPQCLLCGIRIGAGDAVFCPDCLRDLPVLSAAHCPDCLVATDHGERCDVCLADPLDFDRAYALYRYEFPVTRLVHALKYQTRFALARVWGLMLAAQTANFPADIVLPLPLYDDRLAERGYNQALEIARHYAHARGLPLDSKSLRKHRATSSQSNLSLKARQRNLKGAFSCQRDFSGRCLLLIDDVLTTGATASEAAHTLKRHGAASVSIATIARTLRS